MRLERRHAATWKEVSTLYDLEPNRETMVCAPWVAQEPGGKPTRGSAVPVEELAEVDAGNFLRRAPHFCLNVAIFHRATREVQISHSGPRVGLQKQTKLQWRM